MILLPSGSAEAEALNFKAALEYSRLHRGLCLLAQQNGRMLVEDYSDGAAPTKDYPIYSITKNLWALAAAAAVQDRLLNYSEKVSDTLPEWKGRESVTISELLSMTSGLDPGVRQIYGRGVLDKGAVAIALPFRAPAGRIFDYGPGPIEVFGEVLERKLRPTGETRDAYLRRRVLEPLGIVLRDDRRDRSGNVLLSTGASVRPAELLQLGRHVLHLKNGGGTAAYEALFRGTRANPGYGLTFWLNTRARRFGSFEMDAEEALDRWPTGSALWRRACLASEAPRDMVEMIGSHNQRVYVVPSMQLVIVRMGAGDTFKDGDFWRRLRSRGL